MICLRRCVCRARLEQFRTYRTVGRRAVLLEFVPNHRRFLSSGLRLIALHSFNPAQASFVLPALN